MPKVELEDLELAVSPLTDTIYIMSPDKRAPKGKRYKVALHKKDVTAAFWRCLVERMKEEEGGVELRVGGELQYVVELRDMRAARDSDPQGGAAGPKDGSEADPVGARA